MGLGNLDRPAGHLFHDGPQPGLLIVGAYRPGEIDATHPLTNLMPMWLAPPHPRCCATGEPTPADLSVMLAEMFRLPSPQAQRWPPPSEPRTGGNPFDTVTLLNTMREEGALARDDEGWSWDESMIRRYLGQGDVVDLLATRIITCRRPPQNS